MKRLKYVLVFIVTFISCSEDESNLISNDNNIEINSPSIIVQDFEKTIFENPVANQLLGTIEANTDQGSLIYTINSQNPLGAFNIDENSGELFVNDPSLFDYQLNSTLVGTVEIVNGSTSEYANITVNLIEPISCVNSNEMFQQEIMNYITNNNFAFDNTLDNKTHGYSFKPNSDLTLCSIGYQGYDNNDYLIQILDANENIIYNKNLSFSTSEQEEKVLDNPISLIANQNYTVLRIRDTQTFNDVIGYVIMNDYSNSDPGPSLPYIFDKITIISSHFEDTLGGQIPPDRNYIFPYITLGFSE